MLVNATYGLGYALLDQHFEDIRRIRLREELAPFGVAVAHLLPRSADGDLVARLGSALVARLVVEAMENGEGDIVGGLMAKLKVAAAAPLPPRAARRSPRAEDRADGRC